MKTLAQLKAECEVLGLRKGIPDGCKSRLPYLVALREHRWEKKDTNEPLPDQTQPMLLSEWADLDAAEAANVEAAADWVIQPKLDGVRVLVHIDEGSIRITGRRLSDSNYRLTEHQCNVPHLHTGVANVKHAVLDGELVCPIEQVNTGEVVTKSSLQATVAIIASSPEKAIRIQQENSCFLRVHCFDVLRSENEDVTHLPLVDRLDVLEQVMNKVENRHYMSVPTYAVNKLAVHEYFLAHGGEGSVWKKLDQPYETGRRVKHWIKRKRSLELLAFVTGFKLGTPGRGNEKLIGAVEFSVRESNGSIRPIAWVSSWSTEQRVCMTAFHSSGEPTLCKSILGKSAIIGGQDISARSNRIRHAKLIRWL